MESSDINYYFHKRLIKNDQGELDNNSPSHSPENSIHHAIAYLHTYVR